VGRNKGKILSNEKLVFHMEIKILSNFFCFFLGFCNIPDNTHKKVVLRYMGERWRQ
jgi:hypothetical protein